jgi:HEAT repeat protein
VADIARWVAGEANGIANLHKAIAHESDFVKGEAIDVLLKLDESEALNALPTMLLSPTQSVRRVACEIAGEFKEHWSEVEAVLLRQLANEIDPVVRYACVGSLARIGSHRSLPILNDIVRSDKGVDFEGRPISELASVAIRLITEDAK